MRKKVLVAAVAILAAVVIREVWRGRPLQGPVVHRDAAMPPIASVDERPGFARAQVEGIVVAFTAWATHDTTASCATLPAFTGLSEDPWGTRPRILCTQRDPLRLEVTSAGPDRTFDTADDLAARSP